MSVDTLNNYQKGLHQLYPYNTTSDKCRYADVELQVEKRHR